VERVERRLDELGEECGVHGSPEGVMALIVGREAITERVDVEVLVLPHDLLE
jgi:hypothetical protein